MSIRLPSDWATLDPQGTAGGSTTASLAAAMYDLLITVVPGGTIVPYLAKSWTATSTSLTFTLRKDATCSDGAPVTATVVMNSFQRLAKSSVPLVGYFGPGPYTFAADDAAGTFTMNLGTPFSAALESFADYRAAAIVCPAGIQKGSLDNASAGSGPYVLDSAQHGNQVTMHLRTDWNWGPGGITARSAQLAGELVYKVVNNQTTTANLLLTGGLDVALVNGSDLPRLLADKSLNHYSTTSFAPTELLLNHAATRATSDLAVRRAISTAVDPKQFAAAAFQGRGIVSPTLVVPSVQCFDRNASKLIPKHSVVAAKAVLTAAGYTAGSDGIFSKGGRPLTVNVLSSADTFNSGPDYLVSTLTAVGFSVQPTITDVNTITARYSQSNFDIFTLTNSVVTPTIQASAKFVTGPFPPAGSNQGFNSNPVANSEAAAALASTGATTCQHWEAMQESLLKNYDYVPLVAPDQIWFTRNGLKVTPGVFWLQPQLFKR